MPKVSVIIPNYNHAQYLVQRIDSVLNQTYTDFEVIILDDCSTDNSKEIIERYRENDNVKHIVYNTENSGSTFNQWHKGIGLASGDYIWIAESDDWCENILLENIVIGIESDKQCVLGYCQSFCISENNEIRFQSAHNRISDYVEGKKFVQDYLLERNPLFNAGMVVWRKDVYGKISKNFMKYKLTGDYCFWIETAGFGNVFISGKVLNYFRAHDKNVSIKARNNGLDFTELIPMLNELFSRKVITKFGYDQVLKKLYASFSLSKKIIPRENINIIEELFSSSNSSKFSMRIYVIQKYLQNKLRIILHV